MSKRLILLFTTIFCALWGLNGCAPEAVVLQPTARSPISGTWMGDYRWRSRGVIAVLPVHVTRLQENSRIDSGLPIRLIEREYSRVLDTVTVQSEGHTHTYTVETGRWKPTTERTVSPGGFDLSDEQVGDLARCELEMQLMKSGYTIIDRDKLRTVIDERDLALALSGYGGEHARKLGGLLSADALAILYVEDVIVDQHKTRVTAIHDSMDQARDRFIGALVAPVTFGISLELVGRYPDKRSESTLTVGSFSLRGEIRLIDCHTGKTAFIGRANVKSTDLIRSPLSIVPSDATGDACNDVPKLDAVLAALIVGWDLQ